MTSAERRREKLKNAVLYFVKHDKTVGLTKLMKLLFYLDFRLYRKCGESLSGQVYEAWPFGPVPTDVWRELHEKEDHHIGLKTVVKIIPVREDPREEATGIKLAVVPGAKFSDKYFNGREYRELVNISEIFKNRPAQMIVDASHARNTPWDVIRKTKGLGEIIDYELALDGCDDEHKAYVHEVRDDAKLLESLLG